MSNLGEILVFFKGVIFTTRKKNISKKKFIDQLYLEGPSARKTVYFCFFIFMKSLKTLMIFPKSISKVFSINFKHYQPKSIDLAKK